MINENILTELKQLKQSIEEVSVYDLNVYSSMELYSRVAGKINELIKEVMTYQGLLSEELLKELDYINNHMDSFLYEIRTNSEMAINDMNIAKDEMIEQVTNQIKENQLLINSLTNYSSRLSYLERMLDLLFSENVSHRTKLLLEGNHLSLTNSKEGLIQINSTQGNTLVNLVNDTEQLNKTWKVEVKMNYVKPDTDYTLIFELSDIVNNDDFKRLFVSIENQANEQMNNVIFTNGFKIAKVTTRNSSSNIALDTNNDVYACFWIPNTGTSIYSLKNIIVLEGDYTNKPIPDYFEGMKSTFEDKVVTQEMVDSGKELAENLGKYKVEYKVTGKNKFDGNIIGNGYINPSNGSIVSNSKNAYYNYIPVKGGETLYISSQVNVAGAIISQYDGSKNFISAKDGTILRAEKIDNNARFIRISVNFKTDVSQQLSDSVKIQIEEGSVATPYEPYKEFTKTYYLNSPLLEGDTIEESNGNVYHVHRCEIVAYIEGDESTYKTDKINTLKIKSPTKELISENDDLMMKCFNNSSLDYETVIPVEQTDITFTGEGTSTTSLLVEDINLDTDEITREV